MPDLVTRQRSLLPIGTTGVLEGWMDEDAATAAGQLFGSGPRGVLVIDSRELLSSTARVVGAALGELHFKVWMALITLHVLHGMPDNGRASTTLGELGRLISGRRESSGKDTYALLDVMHDLRDTKFTVPGYDLVNQRPAAAVSDTSLLINLVVDEVLLKRYAAEKARRAIATRRRRALAQAKAGRLRPADLQRLLAALDAELGAIARVDRAIVGKQMGGKDGGTLAWRMHPDYTQRLGETELRRFDWNKAHVLRGVALTLWMGFTSPRIPYRRVFEAPRDLQIVDVPLTPENCHALGVRASADAARRRTFNDAGARVVSADRSFQAFEAHGGRGRDSFLRVVRTAPPESPLARPMPAPVVAGQLTLPPTS
jgi:hypothetical protein